VRHPLPFRIAFWQFFRNSSPRVPFSPAFLDSIGIGAGAATTCIIIGLFGAVPVSLGFAYLVTNVLGLLWPLVVLPALFILCQGSITYLAYRVWFRCCYPAA
jgi:hypothetical protein